jgi:hypothetical protein
MNKINLFNTSLFNKFFIEKLKEKNNLLIGKSIKFFSFNLFKNKILHSLHLYTGYSKINIYFKSLQLMKKLKNECKFNSLFQYTKFSILNILNNECNSLFFTLKYLDSNKLQDEYEKNILLKLSNFSVSNTKLDGFLKKFPFYIIRHYKIFLTNIFYLFSLKNQNIKNTFLILKNSFYYLYKTHDNHFMRAFKFYKSLINKLYSYKLLKICGIKIIFKGRFGKVRKQIRKFNFGFLKLNTFIQHITYYNSLMLTKRGSYGFHIWFAEGGKK